MSCSGRGENPKHQSPCFNGVGWGSVLLVAQGLKFASSMESILDHGRILFRLTVLHPTRNMEYSLGTAPTQ